MAIMRALCSMLWATIALCPQLCSHNVQRCWRSLKVNSKKEDDLQHRESRKTGEENLSMMLKEYSNFRTPQKLLIELYVRIKSSLGISQVLRE